MELSPGQNQRQPAKMQTAKVVPPPPGLPVLGYSNPQEVAYFGRTNYGAGLEEKRFVFGIKREDRMRHTYVVGKSGTGKSKLLELMIRQDIAYNHGCCVLDSEGELCENILDFIPAERLEQVCVLDPSDSNPPCFNPLLNVDPLLKHQVAQGFAEIFERRLGPSWTPQAEHLARLGVLALLDVPDATLESFIRLLTEGEYRTYALPFITDPMVARFFGQEYAEWSQRHEGSAVIPIISKMSQFLADPSMRRLFSSPSNKIDFVQLMNKREIILITADRAKLGIDNAAFFESILAIKLKEAASLRAREKQQGGEIAPFYIYLDNFHGLVPSVYEGLLAEGRRSGVALTLSHQFVEQLPDRLHTAVLGGVGNIIVFRVGGDDANLLKTEFSPVFDARDMMGLGVGEFYIKMLVDGEIKDPFSAESLKVMPPKHHTLREEIIASSRKRFSTS